MQSNRSTGSGLSSLTTPCPLCGAPQSDELSRLHLKIEPAVLLNLQRQHPGWLESSGACPECVRRAAEHLRLARSPTSIQEALLLPYPVYHPAEARLLPTPRRLHASTQYHGQGVTIAFIDSGFYPHPDFTRPQNRILACVDATDSQPVEKADFSQPHLTSWHGLMTSSLAAGNGFKSGELYRGVASQAELVLVKAGNRYSSAIREVDIQRALAWVVANQARFQIRVVNISLAGDYPPLSWRLTELDQLVEEAVANGMVVVTAVGNSGIERLLPPATAPSAISVGGLDDRNSFDRDQWRLYSSNYGRAYQQTKPDLIAPATWLAAPMLPHTRVHQEGIRLWQFDQVIDPLYRSLEAGGKPSLLSKIPPIQRLRETRSRLRRRMIEQKYIHSHYQHVEGTSMAAPIVASVVAQMIEANPSLSPGQIKALLKGSARPLAGAPVERQGAGVLEAPAAVSAARRAAGGPLHGLPDTPLILPEGILFTFYDPSFRLQQVALVGSFNQWQPQGHFLQANGPGLWQILIPPLAAGTYYYKFLLPDSWQADPENLRRAEDGFGGFHSILEVSLE
jgi:serine protease AprX